MSSEETFSTFSDKWATSWQNLPWDSRPGPTQTWLYSQRRGLKLRIKKVEELLYPGKTQRRWLAVQLSSSWSGPLFLAYEKWGFLTTWPNLIWIPTDFTCELNSFVLQQQQNLGRRCGTSKMHLNPPVALAAVRSKVVALLLLICCWLLLPLWESVIVLCFVVRYFVSILVLQSFRWGRES